MSLALLQNPVDLCACGLQACTGCLQFLFFYLYCTTLYCTVMYCDASFAAQAVCAHWVSLTPVYCTVRTVALYCTVQALQAVCAHWLSPIPTQEYPNFSAWMLYGKPTKPRTCITDRLCTALFLLCRLSAPTGCPQSLPKNTPISPLGCFMANQLPHNIQY